MLVSLVPGVVSHGSKELLHWQNRKNSCGADENGETPGMPESLRTVYSIAASDWHQTCEQPS